MKKMRKLVAAILVLAMVFALSACGKNSDNTGSPTGSTTPNQGGNSGETKTYDITVWCAEAAVALTQRQIEAFNNTNTLNVKLNATVSAVGEGDAATQMITSVEDGADLFFFAQDQFARLIQAGALAPLGNKASETIVADNTEGSSAACKSGDTYYAYPVTADNGYFLYYDKSVLSDEDVKSVEKIIEVCEANGKNFCFGLTESAWYGASYFFGAGCKSEWTLDDNGKTSGFTDTFNSENGLAAGKAMYKLLQSSCYVGSSNAPEGFEKGAAAVVSGTWDFANVKEKLGDNLGATKLPTFTVDGKTYQLGSFSGYKLIGVKPQTDSVKGAAIQALALYLTSETAQVERFNELAWGPSNKKAKEADAVKANAGQIAIAEQESYAVLQGAIDGAWWDIGKALNEEIKESDGSDAAIQAALSNYNEKLKAIFTMSDDVKNAWTVIGNIAGTNWDKDFEMTKEGDVWTTKEALTLNEGDAFKVRQGLSWDVNYGADGAKDGSNIKVENAGTFCITFNESTHEIGYVEK